MDLNTLSGIEYEKICQILIEKMGFCVTATKASGDGGIDLIAQNHQPLLSGKYIIQCKRYAGGVGEPIIRDLYGVVMSERANKGILMTTGYFTKQAISFADEKPIELIDGDKFKELLSLYLKNEPVESLKETLIDKQRIKYDSNFLPLIHHPIMDFSMDTYVQLKRDFNINSDNLSNVGKMIEFLQYYVLSYNKYEWEDITDKEFQKSKYNAIVNTIVIAEKIKHIPFLYPQYLSIVAQNYFLLGYWNIALEHYEKILRLPGVLFDVNYSRSNYTGELETAAKLIHNMCIIYVCMNNMVKAKELMKQYKYIFDLELQRTLRLMRNNVEIQNDFAEESERLIDVFDKKYFYFDTTLCGFSFRGNSILSAIYEDCKRNNESCEIRVEESDEYQVAKNNYATIKIIYKGIFEPEEIWEAKYLQNKSVEFCDVNKLLYS